MRKKYRNFMKRLVFRISFWLIDDSSKVAARKMKMHDQAIPLSECQIHVVIANYWWSQWMRTSDYKEKVEVVKSCIRTNKILSTS